MEYKTHLAPLRILLNYKMISICLVVSAFVIGVPYYIKHSIETYTHLHELEINIDSIRFNWRIWKIPSIIINKINIKNNGKNPTFTHMNLKSIVIEPDYVALFKSYFKDYNFLLKIDALKIFLINGSRVKAGTISSNLHYRNNIFRIHNFNLHPLKIHLDTNHTSCIKNDNDKTCQGRLLIYVIKGEGQYHSLERELEIYLQVPQASTQMHDSTAYGLQAKGKVKLQGLMPYQYAKDPDDPGVRGTITYTIDNFSNMLHQLNQAKFISTLAENLGTIIGYPIPRIDPFTQQTEIFTNAVSLDMTFKPDGTYIGQMKL